MWSDGKQQRDIKSSTPLPYFLNVFFTVTNSGVAQMQHSFFNRLEFVLKKYSLKDSFYIDLKKSTA